MMLQVGRAKNGGERAGVCAMVRQDVTVQDDVVDAADGGDPLHAAGEHVSHALADGWACCESEGQAPHRRRAREALRSMTMGALQQPVLGITEPLSEIGNGVSHDLAHGWGKAARRDRDGGGVACIGAALQ
ncbi:hypothetical protein ACSSS7_007286 [Eimeria intestinalis]